MSDDTTTIVRQLLASEVPEIAAGEVEIKAVSRRVAYRSKVALYARSDSVDPVAACVGVRGSRIKKVVDALQGERIDLVRWHNDIKTLILNSLQPAEVQAVVVDEGQRRATVFVAPGQRSLVEGHRGINIALASELVGYAIVVETT
jgi:N utilization substance protein A